jgi:hypothetical protein
VQNGEIAVSRATNNPRMKYSSADIADVLSVHYQVVGITATIVHSAFTRVTLTISDQEIE